MLRASSPGFATETRVLSFQENARIELALEPLPTRTRQEKTRGSSDDGARGEEPQTESQEPDCSIPYYLDERGIRRLKRECL